MCKEYISISTEPFFCTKYSDINAFNRSIHSSTMPKYHGQFLIHFVLAEVRITTKKSIDSTNQQITEVNKIY